MKLRHIIYNSIGLGLAALAAGLVCFNFLGMNSLFHGRRLHLFVDLVGGAMVVFVGGGAAFNIAANRWKAKPTHAMIIVYCSTILFLPLGIWGIIELRLNHERRRAKGARPMKMMEIDVEG